MPLSHSYMHTTVRCSHGKKNQVFDWHLGPIGKLCDLVFKGSGQCFFKTSACLHILVDLPNPSVLPPKSARTYL